MRGDLLVLDESHWVADPDRGHHWARLVLTGEYREMHLISAAEAYLLLKPLVADAKKLDRRQPQAALPARRAARAGPRRAACGRRRSSSPSPARPSTPSPPRSTRTGRARSASSTARCPRPPGATSSTASPRGELEVLVTTDVIGHGINVPATTVLFAETTKFDGVERRPLRTWETAQIAGRAGRYGLTGHGQVGVLAGVTGLKPDAGLLVAGAEVARGDAMSDLPKRAPRLRPELDDLGAFEPVDLPEALTRWMAWARAATRDQAMTADDVTSLDRSACTPCCRCCKGPLGAAGDLWTVWRLINLPIDYNPPRRTRWLVLAQAALQSAAGLPVPPETVLAADAGRGSVEDYEQAAAAARDAQTLLRSFPGVAGLTSDDAAWVEDAVRRPASPSCCPTPSPCRRRARCADCGTGDRAVVQHLPRLLGRARPRRGRPRDEHRGTPPATGTGRHRRPRDGARPAGRGPAPDDRPDGRRGRPSRPR